MSSLTNGIRILRCFTEARPELTLGEISDMVGLAKSTVHRLLGMLLAEGLLQRTAHGYRLGIALFTLGGAVLLEDGLQEAARGELVRLSRATNETVHLGVLDRGEVVYVQKVESPYVLRISTRLGGRLPAHCTGTGKAILAFQAPPAIDQVIGAGLARFTEQTIVEPAAFREHLAWVRAHGHAFGDEEVELGVRAVASPIRNRAGRVIAAVSVAGPVTRMPTPRLQGLVPTVVAAGQRISRWLGWDPSLGGARSGRRARLGAAPTPE
jgi:DNA-binding IclR family transcriptional regulator